MTINCKGKLIDLKIPKVMGILNVTPNSFYDGGLHHSLDKIEQQTEKMLNEGADIIDVGAYSTQPNASFVSQEEELGRIIPVVRHLVKKFPDIILSVDTFRAEVAKQTIELGAAIINDVSAGFLDDQMMAVVGAMNVPYIMMHMKGTPQNMQQFTDYEDVMHDMILYFSDLKFPDIILSVDTFRAEVAKQTIELGAAIINDVSAGFLDDQMMAVVGAMNVPYIMMHMKGTPQNMQQFTDYEDVMHDMILYF